jgi:hypothetical protein
VTATGPRTLASYVPLLVDADDEWRLRLLIHDFGMVWADEEGDQPLALVSDEPAHIDARCVLHSACELVVV